MNFFSRLEARARAVNSLLCVGLDPRVNSAAELRAECQRIIDATAEIAVLYKPNSGFFEAFGAEGMAALADVIAYIPADIPVLLDAKRGDIADTAEAYAQAIFTTLGADAVTANPYLGGEALAPFLRDPNRAVFVLCKTSNPGADELQRLPVTEGNRQSPLFEVVARRAQQWNQLGNIGLVVGGTDPTSLARARAVAPDLWFLMPGIGPQGADLAAALTAGLRPDGMGLLITASRQIARAADPKAAATQLRDQINQLRENLQSTPARAVEPTDRFAELARDLVTSGCVRFGQFTLKSGIISPIYMDLRRLVTYPAILRRVAKAYAAKLAELTYDRIAGIPFAALPIATAVGLEMEQPMVYPRLVAKEYGTRANVEGEYVAGETIAVIDDVTTTGDSKFEAIEKLEAVGLIVRDVIVLIDRQQGASELLAEAGYRLHTVLTLPALLDEWQRQGVISPAQNTEVRTFLAANSRPSKR